MAEGSRILPEVIDIKPTAFLHKDIFEFANTLKVGSKGVLKAFGRVIRDRKTPDGEKIKTFRIIKASLATGDKARVE